MAEPTRESEFLFENFSPRISKDVSPIAPLWLRREEASLKPRVQRAWTLFITKLQDMYSEEEINQAFEKGGTRGVMALYSDKIIRKALIPFESILRDAFITAGKKTARGRFP